MTPILYSTIAVTIVSTISLVGIFTLSLQEKILNKALKTMVAFATGALLGDVFIHILPEITEESKFNLQTSAEVLLGIILFFLLEKFIHWHHCHHPERHHKIQPVAWLNLIGDGFHNLLDGMIITASFLISLPIGISTSLAVILHEIPQEIGDFAILVHSGLKPSKALLLNFLSALTSLLGIGLFLIIGEYIDNFSLIMLPITAGGFIYIAGSDLIPELHKHSSTKDSILQLIGIICGILIMVYLKTVG